MELFWLTFDILLKSLKNMLILLLFDFPVLDAVDFPLKRMRV